MHDALFADQTALDDTALEAKARSVVADVEGWRTCFAARQPEERIARDQKLAADLGARGTPTFFINGRVLLGAQPLATFRQLVDEELVKAQESKLPRDGYYETAVLKRGHSPTR
jgi:protein-disulfide isomerase